MGVSKSRFLIVGRWGDTNKKAMTSYSCGLPPWQPWWKQQGVTQSSCFGAADSYSFNSNWTRRPYSNHPFVPPSFARAQLGAISQDFPAYKCIDSIFTTEVRRKRRKEAGKSRTKGCLQELVSRSFPRRCSAKMQT